MTSVPGGGEGGDSPLWLYVTRRLDLEMFPNIPLWAAPAVSVASGGAAGVYYRLTAGVLAWLEAAGRTLEAKYLAGDKDVPRGQLDAYLDAMRTVYEFAGRHLGEESVRAARARPPELPEAPRPL